jgi:copper chaperone
MERYRIEGMTCEGCARAMRRAVEAALPGLDIAVDVQAGTIALSGGPVDEARLRAATTAAGFVFLGRAAAGLGA